MWNINGKVYDLTSYLENHPGGKDILIQTKGLEDCSALFETYHAFSDKLSIKMILDKYEVKDSEKKDILHDFTSYNELTERVRKVFPDRKSIKATKSWQLLNIINFSLYLPLLYFVINTKMIYLKCLLAMVASFIECSFSFNLLHDSSHYAISTYPLTNEFIGNVFQSWSLWNHKIWFYHHVYSHHSFTGSDKDVDKDLYDYKNDYYLLNTVIFGFGFPGQHLIQAILYLKNGFTKNYSYLNYTQINDDNRMTIPSHVYVYNFTGISVAFLKLYFFYNVGGLVSLFYCIVWNLFYYINIVGDHDFYETKVENHYDGEDWAKRQICNSGNFLNGSLLWTYLFSGINYQIEHHLFPNVCGHLYPKIAPIVKAYCMEKGWNYVHKKTLYDSYLSFMKRIKYNKHN
jgi:fatty acid desaturase